MKRSYVFSLCFAGCVTLLSGLGCHKEVGPPPPLAAERIPTEMQKVFGNARPETKEIVAQVLSALQNKDYPAAYQGVQMLCTAADSTKEQRLVAARAMLTITGLLQAAQAQGDANAAAALKLHQMTK